jgi:hypothetical protein
MNLYIMSRGRAGKVTTLKWIPDTWKDRTYLVVPKAEVLDYYEKSLGGIRHDGTGPQVIAAPESVTNYSQKFQWILDGLEVDAGPLGLNDLDRGYKAVILDDDLVFSQFSKDGKLLTIRDSLRLDEMFVQMEVLLDSYALVGVHPRQNAHETKDNWVENCRIICIQGINRRLIGHVKVDQFPILADVVLNCTLLARGQANAILTTFFQDHGPCQAPGGCSIYRTPDMQRAAVEYLTARFPGFVKVVERRPKVAKWMGDVRYDYTCQWKRLYAAGLEYAAGLRGSPDIEVSEASLGAGMGVNL